MDSWQRLFIRRNRPAWVVLLVCLSLTLAAWYGLRVQSIKNAGQQFELHVLDVTSSIEDRLRQHEQILLGGTGLFEASDSVERAEWHAYVERLNLGKNYPGILGVGYSQIIKPADLQAHIAAIRAQGFPGYTVRPPGERSLYTSIIYLEPFSGRNLAAFGYDMMSDDTRAKAMRMAAESGHTSISAKVKLVQETHGKEQAGFLMYIPVYRKHLPLTSPEERWNALQGFVYSPYRIDDLMAGILGKQALLLDFVIFDGEAETDESRMFVSAGGQVTHTPPKMLSTLRTIHAYGHIWTVRLYSRPEFEADFQSPLNTLILVLGGGISMLLFTLVSFLVFRREHAEEMAEQMTHDIRANEEKLRQSEARTHAILEGAEHLIISTDAKGVIQSFNRSAEKHLGYRAEDVVGKSTAAIFHDPDEVVRRAQELTAAGTPVEPGFEVFVIRARQLHGGDTNEWTYIRKDGSRFPVSLTVTALRDSHDEINAFLGIATDITERKNVERLQSQFSAIIESSTDAIMSKTLEGVVLSWNPAAERMFGYNADEIIGRPMALLIPPEHAEEEPQILAKIRRGEFIDHFETTRRRKDGLIFPVSVSISPIIDKMGVIVGASKIVRDISERTRADSELRKLSRAIEQSPVSVVITNAKGNIEYINAKFSEVTGYTVEEVMGRNPRIVQSGLTPVSVYQSMWEAILSGERWRGKLQNRKKSGELFWEEIYISAIRDNEGMITNFVAVKEDITERIKVERMKNEFISTVSHELRTPLTSIRGALALIAGGVVGELPAKAKPLVDIAHKNSERLILLVNDILDMEKIEAGKMEFDIQPVKLMPLLKQAIDGNRAYAEQYRVGYELENELPEAVLRVDKNRLMQVLTNLMSNAAKFSPSGGKVSIAVEHIGQHIRIAVKDNGPGIPEGFKNRIFQKFAQDDSSDTRKKGGTGLGLAITKVLVEQMGGSIGFDSQPDVLTTFFVEFPECIEKSASPGQSPPLPSKGAAGAARPKVLHVEDDLDIFHVVKGVVGIEADMTQAVSLAEARQMLARSRYDLVILDLKLPDGLGTELLPLLKGVSPPTPVLLFTAFDVGAEDAKAVDAVLIKSFTYNPQLLAVIKRLLGI